MASLVLATAAACADLPDPSCEEDPEACPCADEACPLGEGEAEELADVRRVFVTSQRFRPDFGSGGTSPLAEADTLCTLAAEGAELALP